MLSCQVDAPGSAGRDAATDSPDAPAGHPAVTLALRPTAVWYRLATEVAPAPLPSGPSSPEKTTLIGGDPFSLRVISLTYPCLRPVVPEGVTRPLLLCFLVVRDRE